MKEFTFDTEIFSDLYKDVTGVRPRGHEFFTASDERKQEIWDFMLRQLEEEIAHQDMMDKKHEEEFDARVKSTIECGARDEDTAIRWLLEADDRVNAEYDDGSYVAYLYDLSYQSKWVSVFDKVLKGM